MPRGKGANRGRQIFRTPGKARQPPRHIAIFTQSEDRLGRFRGNGQYQRPVIAPLAQSFIQIPDRRRTLCLGQHDPGGAAIDHRVEVGIDQSAINRIHPDEKHDFAVRSFLQERRNLFPRAYLGADGDRILKVEDQGVRATSQRLAHSFGPVTRYEQQ